MDAPRRLYRSEKDKILGGVCGGLSEYFSIDPTLIRLIFILIFFFGGSGFLAYIIMWIIMPSEYDVKNNTTSDDYIKKNSEELKGKAENFATNVSVAANNSTGRIVIGLFVILVGLGFLFGNLGFPFFFDIWRLWPLLLILVGFILIINLKK